MIFINANNEYPRFKGDLLLEFPDWKDGDALPHGWKSVNEVEVNIPDGFIAVEDFPTLQNEEYYQNWIVIEDNNPPIIPWNPIVEE